jgi:GT2 family glycosyltransferase
MVETSVILLNYNGLRLLKKCLPKALNQTYTDYEVILVDNGSTDGSVAWVKTHYPSSKYPRLRFFHIMPNRGFTGGNNYGAKQARGKYIILLSNDTLLPRNWLAELIKRKRKEGDNVVLGSFMLMEGVEKETMHAVFKRNVIWTMNLVGENVEVPVTKAELRTGTFECFYVSGNTLCYSKSIAKEPFDQIYFIYSEDIYFCWKARIKGCIMKTVLDSRVDHVGAASKKITKRDNTIAVFNGTKNQVLNYLLFYNAWNLIRVFPLFMVSQIGHVVLEPRKIIKKLKAYLWVLLNARRIWTRRRAIQRARKVPDHMLIKQMSYKFFENKVYPLHPVFRFATKVMNGLFWLYCFVLRIKTRDL